METRKTILEKEAGPVTYSCTEYIEEESPDSKSNIRHYFFLFSLLSLNLLCGLCYVQPATFFPSEASEKGVSATMNGWIFAVPSLVRTVLTPILGYFIMSIGIKFLTVSGIFIYGVSVVLFGFLIYSPDGWTFIIMCLICRGFEGIGWAGFAITRYILITEKCPNNVGKISGAMYCSRAIGISLGPPIGGALFQYLGYVYSFGLIGILLVIFILISAPFIPSVQGTLEKEKSSKLTYLKHMKAWVGLFSSFISCVIYTFIQPILGPQLKKFHLDAVTIGVLFMLYFSIVSVVLFASNWISEKKTCHGEVLIGSSILTILSYLTIGPAPFLIFLPCNIYTVIGSLIIMGIGMGGMYGPCYLYLLRTAREIGLPDDVDTFGMLSVLINMSVGTGTFVGPLFAGISVDYFGFEWACCIAACVIMLNVFAHICVIISERISVSREPKMKPRNYMSLEIKQKSETICDKS